MSENKVVRFGPELWQKGTRRSAGSFASDKAHITSMRQWDDGSLGARPSWGSVDATLVAADYPAGSVVFPAIATKGSGLTIYDGFVAYSPDGSGGTGDCEFFEWDGTKQLDTVAVATGNAVTMHSSVRRVSDYQWVIFGFTPQQINTQNYGAPVTPTPTIDDTSDIATVWSYNTHETRGGDVHQGRAFYFGTAREANQHESATDTVWYSNAYDYMNFASTAQFFQVDGRVEGVRSIGANLFIWTKDGHWYMLQGRGDPAVSTLNYLGKGRIPARGRNIGVLDRQGLFMSSDARTVVTIGEGGQMDDRSLADFGASDVSLGYDETDVRPNPAVNSLNNIVVLPDLLDGCVRMDGGVWTLEMWATLADSGNFKIMFDELDSKEKMAEWDGVNWLVRSRATDLIVPELLAGQLEDASEIEGTVILPRIVQPHEQVRVRRVIIDGRTYSSNGTTYPAAALTVSAEDGKANSWSFVLGPASQPLSAVANSPDTPIRVTATPSTAMAWTHFVDVTITDLIGFTIEAIAVEVEISKGPIS